MCTVVFFWGGERTCDLSIGFRVKLGNRDSVIRKSWLLGGNKIHILLPVVHIAIQLERENSDNWKIGPSPDLVMLV